MTDPRAMGQRLGMLLALCPFGAPPELLRLQCGVGKGVGGIVSSSSSSCISGDHPPMMSVMVTEVFMEVGGGFAGASGDDLGIVVPSCNAKVGGGR